MVPWMFFAAGSTSASSNHLGVDQAADGRQHAGAALGVMVRMASTSGAIELADDDHLLHAIRP